jgi:hypothetical protein
MIKNFTLAKFLILSITTIIYFYYIFKVGLSGHDSFQYIEWSNKLYETPNLTFNRVILYIYINIINNLLSWPYYGLGVSNLIAYLISSLFFFKISKKIKLNEKFIITSFIVFSTSPLILNSFSFNYISNIETMFFLILLYFSISILVTENKVKYILHGFFSSLIFFVHEEKIILVLIIYFFLFIYKKKKINLIYSLTVFLVLNLIIFLFFYNYISFYNYLRVANSVSDKINDISIFSNFISNLIYSFKINFGYLYNFILPIFILIFFSNNKIDDFLKMILFIAIAYLFVISLLIKDNESLSRTYGVVFVSFNFLIFKFIQENIKKLIFHKYILYLSVLLIVPIIYNFYEVIYKKNINNLYLTSFNFIKKNFDKDKVYVLELPSFEDRRDMWNENQIYGYGLSSVSYLGKKSINLNSLKFKTNLTDEKMQFYIINNFDLIIAINKDNISHSEKKILDLIRGNVEKWRVHQVNSDLIIYEKI